MRDVMTLIRKFNFFIKIWKIISSDLVGLYNIEGLNIFKCVDFGLEKQYSPFKFRLIYTFHNLRPTPAFQLNFSRNDLRLEVVLSMKA